MHLIEGQLKLISDKLLQESKPEEFTDKDSERYRQLTGVFRVGQLEKGTLLTGDSLFELIVLFDKHPRLDLIGRVLNELQESSLFVKQEKEALEGFEREHLKMGFRDEQHLMNEASVVITYDKSDEVDGGPVIFKLSFSTLASEEKEGETSEEVKTEPEPVQMEIKEEVKEVCYI